MYTGKTAQANIVDVWPGSRVRIIVLYLKSDIGESVFRDILEKQNN